jgi:transcription initiation factor TFIID subunit 6
VIGQKDLFCIEENEIEIKDIINNPLPPTPKDVVFKSHWLSILGKQPETIENLDSLDVITVTPEVDANAKKRKIGINFSYNSYNILQCGQIFQ